MGKETKQRRKKMKVSKCKIAMIILIIVGAGVLNHMADIWTVPLQNDATMAQVNGGDAEFLATQTTNSMLVNVRGFIFPIALFIIGIIVGTEVVTKRTRKTKEEAEENKA
jgi:multisubunit Na+/H+ antiporter MnhB subunit